jgi:hypothetical protein
MQERPEDEDRNPNQVDPIDLNLSAAVNHPQDSLKNLHDSKTEDDGAHDAE